MRRFFLLLIYGVFLSTAGAYIRNCVRYDGVEKWPSVSATILDQTGYRATYPMWTKYSGSQTIDTRAVHFSYSVDGREYRGDRASPDGGGLDAPVPLELWRAYYDPAAPEIAVLIPWPYHGAGFFAFAAASGIMVAVHLLCTLQDVIGRKRGQHRRIKTRKTKRCR